MILGMLATGRFVIYLSIYFKTQTGKAALLLVGRPPPLCSRTALASLTDAKSAGREEKEKGHDLSLPEDPRSQCLDRPRAVGSPHPRRVPRPQAWGTDSRLPTRRTPTILQLAVSRGTAEKPGGTCPSAQAAERVREGLPQHRVSEAEANSCEQREQQTWPKQHLGGPSHLSSWPVAKETQIPAERQGV